MKTALASIALLLLFAGCASNRAPERSSPDQGIGPAAERAEVRQGVESSGPTSAPWTEKVPAVLQGWREKNPSESKAVEFSAARCFARGCIVTATYRDQAAFLAASESLAKSDLFLDWPGPRYRSGAEPASGGGVVADWVFFAPESDQQEKP
jgi:hypothetical protein